MKTSEERWWDDTAPSEECWWDDTGPSEECWWDDTGPSHCITDHDSGRPGVDPFLMFMNIF
jgi:hypothetical protein